MVSTLCTTYLNLILTCVAHRIKGRNFTLANLLQNQELANELEGGSIAIFRLAPQDYHRFHIPAKGTIQEINPISGTYYTGISISTDMRCIICITKRLHA